MSRLGCLPVALIALGFSVACLPAAQALKAPPLDRQSAAAILLAADAARQAAFAAADPQPLRAAFSDAALAPLLPELAGLHRHGARVEERDSSRALVHWAAAEGGGDGVLAVAGQERVVIDGAPDQPWSRIVRQWFASLRWSGARWLVVDSRDLPPSEWWPT